MGLGNADVAHLLLALVLILAAAHIGGQVFTRLRQPRVAGEIAGGLLLGPTVFASVAPQAQASVFHQGVATEPVLAALYQLGLFLLMFCSGAALRSGVAAAERMTTVVVAAIGNLAPFAAGLALVLVINPDNLIGAAHNQTAFMLVFGCAIAVTSVPVISKIMADLGILGTSFARIVLATAVIEDVVLFVVVSVALGIVQPAGAQTFSLAAVVGIHSGTPTGAIYYVVASALFFSLPLALGRTFMQRVASQRWNILASSSPIAFQLFFVLTLTSLAIVLGVAAYFGAFVAGILAGRLAGAHERSHIAIKNFSFSVFIPIYFAIVGLQLDLLHHFDVLFFCAFLLYACVAKAASVYAGARLAGQAPRGARNLAVALNARGGPAIVLASVTYSAGIINESFYVSLIMLALVTSMIAGAWLDAVLRNRSAVDALLAGAGDGHAWESSPAESPVGVRA